MKITNKLHYID